MPVATEVPEVPVVTETFGDETMMSRERVDEVLYSMLEVLKEMPQRAMPKHFIYGIIEAMFKFEPILMERVGSQKRWVKNIERRLTLCHLANVVFKDNGSLTMTKHGRSIIGVWTKEEFHQSMHVAERRIYPQ